MTAVLAALGAAAALVSPSPASAQARPALVRDTDNLDLSPVFFAGRYAVSTAPAAPIVVVPAGKRLVIDYITYAYTTSRSNDQIGQAYLFTPMADGSNQVRLFFPINPVHPLNNANGLVGQDGAFPGRVTFEAGEKMYFIAGNTTTDASQIISITIAGHYVTP